MNLALYITKRIAFTRQPSFSRFIIRIAVTATALSVAVMIIAGAMVTGFQKEISNKVFGFWGNINIRSYADNFGFKDNPISIHQQFYPSLEKVQGIRHIQVYATKPGIIKSQNDIESIVLKGFGKDFDWNFMSRYIVSGKNFLAGDTSKPYKLIISQITANRLNLKTGDDVPVYFIQTPPRARKFRIAGIYKTGLEEYDKLYALTDIARIQELNNWTADSVGGFEVFINNVKDIDALGRMINEDYIGQNLTAHTLKEINPNIFDWLDLQSVNEKVILSLMLLVAVINMTSALLILILERTNMIGILKSLGSSNWIIRRIFLYNAAYIILLGLIIGNGVGIGLCLLQKNFGFIRLSEESYYVSVAPVNLDVFYILALNVGVMIICLLVLVLPSYMVSKISPVKAIRFN